MKYLNSPVLAALVLFLYGCTSTTLPQGSVPIIYDTPASEVPNYIPAENVEVINQFPDYPAGCEFAAATMLLRSYRYDVDIEDLLDTMNYSDDNFVFTYWGDVKTQGAVYAPGLVICINNWLQENGAIFRSMNYSGISWSDVISTLESGRPLIMWYTSDYSSPQYTDFTSSGEYMYYNEHCFVVYGVEDGKIQVADSIHGYTEIEEATFQQIWNECGAMAIGLRTVS